jgi:hypothetical protein
MIETMRMASPSGAVWGRRCARPQTIRRRAVPDRGSLPPVLVVVVSSVLLVWMGAVRSIPVGASVSTLVAYAATDRSAEHRDAALATPFEELGADALSQQQSNFAIDEPALAVTGVRGDAPALAGWYQLAAAEYGVSNHLLRALHQVESNAAPDGCVANLEDSGAIGPFQFKPATFSQYGVDANLDGQRDICAFTDALFSAARYLRALGADDLDSPATRDALVRYGTDADRVMALALHYRAAAGGR